MPTKVVAEASSHSFCFSLLVAKLRLEASATSNWPSAQFEDTLLQEFLVRGDGQFIDSVVFRVAAVASYAGVFDFVFGDLCVQQLPKIGVFQFGGSTLFLALPAVPFPARHPFGNTFADVNAVGKQFDMAASFELTEARYDGLEFHAVVGGFSFAT